MAGKLTDRPPVIVKDAGVDAADESTKAPLTPDEPIARVNRRDVDVFNDALHKLQNNVFHQLRSNR